MENQLVKILNGNKFVTKFQKINLAKKSLSIINGSSQFYLPTKGLFFKI